jgi:PhzF family phenazine biosynthesis protein
MSVRFTQVDAFTAEPFHGNPAAVVVLPSWPSDAWMQSVALEMNLSETAFLVPRETGESALASELDLRWFTPTVEVALCGHATLASTRVLWDEGHARAGAPVTFHTKSGPLTAAPLANGGAEWIELDFPATPPTETAPPPGLAEALGVTPRWVGRSRFDYLVLVDDEADVRAAKPNHSALRRVEARGVMLTAAGAPASGHDFVSRFFAPGAGVDEDPVTGSAHCCLTPYWSARLGKSEMTAYQASRRGGVVRVRLLGDRVRLAGQTRVVARGELLVEPE